MAEQIPQTLVLTLSLCVAFLGDTLNPVLVAMESRLRCVCRNPIGIAFRTTIQTWLGSAFLCGVFSCCCFLQSGLFKINLDTIWTCQKNTFGLSDINIKHIFGRSPALCSLHLLGYKGSDANISIWEENIPISINQPIYMHFSCSDP